METLPELGPTIDLNWKNSPQLGLSVNVMVPLVLPWSERTVREGHLIHCPQLYCTFASSHPHLCIPTSLPSPSRIYHSFLPNSFQPLITISTTDIIHCFQFDTTTETIRICPNTKQLSLAYSLSGTYSCTLGMNKTGNTSLHVNYPLSCFNLGQARYYLYYLHTYTDTAICKQDMKLKP